MANISEVPLRVQLQPSWGSSLGPSRGLVAALLGVLGVTRVMRATRVTRLRGDKGWKRGAKRCNEV